jgi:hypothetical protein
VPLSSVLRRYCNLAHSENGKYAAKKQMPDVRGCVPALREQQNEFALLRSLGVSGVRQKPQGATFAIGTGADCIKKRKYVDKITPYKILLSHELLPCVEKLSELRVLFASD